MPMDVTFTQFFADLPDPRVALTRDTNAGANLWMIRRVAASLLKQNGAKGSIKVKRLSAALNTIYLERVLHGFKAD